MRWVLLAVAMLGCGEEEGTAGDGDLEARVAALEGAVQNAETTIEDLEGRLATVEGQVGTGVDLTEVDGRLDALEAEAAGLWAAIEAGLEVPLAFLSETPVYPAGTGGTFNPLGGHLEVRVPPGAGILAWCVGTSDHPTYPAQLRLVLSSADGSWSEEGPETGADPTSSGSTDVISTMGYFAPPAGGLYHLECEGRNTLGWQDYQVAAVVGVAQ